MQHAVERVDYVRSQQLLYTRVSEVAGHQRRVAFMALEDAVVYSAVHKDPEILVIVALSNCLHVLLASQMPGDLVDEDQALPPQVIGVP